MVGNVFLGLEFLLYDIDNNAIALSKNCALKVKQNLIDISTKDSHNWTENIVGIKDWSIDFEGLVSYDVAKFNTSYFLSKFKLSEPFFVQFGVIQSGFTHTFWGEVAIESIDIDSENGEIVSYSGNLKGIGSLEFTNNGTPAQSGYLKTETDPVFRGSAAFNITNTNKNDWFEAYNKTLTEVAFSTTGNQTTLNLKLRDGSVYSSAFTQVGGIGSTGLDQNLFYTKSISDSRFQPIGNYVGNQYLSDYFYNKTDSDNKYYSKTNPDGYITATSLNGLATESWVLGKNYLTSFTETDPIWQSEKVNYYTKLQSDGRFHPLQNQMLNTFNSVEFDKVKAIRNLAIPNSAPEAPVSGQHYLFSSGTYGSTGSTGVGSGSANYLDDLVDVSISSATNGQALIYNSGIWSNQSVITDLSNYNTKAQDASLYYPLFGNPSAFITSANLSPYALKDASNIKISRLYSPSNPTYYIQHFWDGTGWNLIAENESNDSQANIHLVNINGRAENANRWGGNGADFSTYGTNLSALTGFDSTAGFQKPFLASSVQSWLGLGSFAFRNSIYGNEIITNVGNSGNDIGVSQMLRWKNYGSGHVVFDASNSTAPNGSTLDNTNSQIAWTPSFPTLMGWNGSNSYGVRVDSARISDSAAFADSTTKLQSVSHPNIYWLTNTWDGTYWQLTSNHSSPVNVGHATNADTSQNTNGIGGTPVFLQENSTPSSFLSYNPNTTRWEYTVLSGLKNWLGLGASAYGAETLQSVTDRSPLTNNRIQVQGGSGTAYNTANVELMGAGRAPTLGFHYQGVVASVLTIESTGRIAIMNNPGTSYENFIAQSIQATGDLNVNGGVAIQAGMSVGASAGIQGSLTVLGKILSPTIEASAELIIPTAPPSAPISGKHYLYSTG